MGRTKRREDKGGEKVQQKRKRRRKARTDVSSDSDSKNEEEEEVQVTKEKQNVIEDEDTPMPSTLVEDDVEGGQEVDEQESARKFTEKGGRIPSPLRDLHDPQADGKFEEYYMRLMTEEFGDDLNKIREAKDFEDRSLPMLIRALRQGVNIFNAEEKRSIVKKKA